MDQEVTSIGETIRKIRISRGIEQVELAERIGVTQGHLSKIETGKVNVSIDKLKKISEALGINDSLIFAYNLTEAKLDDENIVIGHISKELREFISLEDSIPYLELSKEIREARLSKEEIEALKLIIMSKKKRSS
jgi:transcriptional regulator with XRE-family HTH domain